MLIRSFEADELRRARPLSRDVPHQVRYRMSILFSSQEGKRGGRQESQCWNFKNCPSASSVRAIDATHFSKVRSYLRAVNKQHGLILNFAVPRLKIKRVISSAKPLPAIPYFLLS